MIVFSAILPHSPLLVPEIGKENNKKLNQTTSALKKIEGDFYSSQPDTVIIISPHADAQEKTFVINFSPKYKGNFGEFGQMALKPTYYGDNGLSYKIKERLETSQTLQLTTNEELDYSILVPLEFVCAHKKNIKIIPISSSGLTLEEHFNFGRSLTGVLRENEKRIAIIASAETSNKLSKKSPSGYASGAKKMEQKILELINSKNYAELIKFKLDQLEKNGLEELKAILILLGIISEINYQPEQLSYESPFGVGHLVMEMGM